MKEKISVSRRRFVQTASLGTMATTMSPSWLFTEAAKKFRIGATFILWGYGPDNLEPALRDMSQLGYHEFETFGFVIEEWEENRGGFKDLVAKYGVPIRSAFCLGDVLDPSKRNDELKKLVKWSKLLREAGGKVIEYCPSPVNRTWRGETKYDYREHKKNIIDSMNDYAKAVTDQGLMCTLHPHTGTPIETEEEVYFAMENVDTRYMLFGPDVGQLQKGKADPVKICKDFMELIEHVHLKDYSGGEYYVGYSPLGEGKVKIKKILKMLEAKKDNMAGMIMMELDYSNVAPPRSPFEAAEVSRDYLQGLGYTF
ncbi:MAG: sugar phosphate isomerase/epimerase [Saprospiraceae bacterium]|nr:sugar phosphate isomerase/epimerase [Saprospiraceae bacterium]